MVASARRQGKSVSIAGGRHAMGGQQFGEASVLVDTRGLDRVLAFDAERGIITVEGGIMWPAVLEYLEHAQRNADCADQPRDADHADHTDGQADYWNPRNPRPVSDPRPVTRATRQSAMRALSVGASSRSRPAPIGSASRAHCRATRTGAA